MEYIILILALVGIVIGADQLVAGAVSIARKFKVSDFVIGAAIVGVGTSMPELTVSFIGALQGNSDIAIGNVVGSNIFNVLGILGLTAMFFPVVVNKGEKRFEIPLCIAMSLLLTLLVMLGGEMTIGRVDGVILLLGFVFFIWYSFRRDRKNSVSENASTKTTIVEKPFWIAILRVVAGLAVLIFSCDNFVDNAIVIARGWGVNDAFISLTLVACGTSLPELAASIAAAVKKNTSLALGNIIGSNIFNISLILGLSSLVTPLNSAGITPVDYAVMTIAAVLPLILGMRGRIGRLGGVFMFILFIAYTVYLLNIQTA
jgi:cation:H+ antiporter